MRDDPLSRLSRDEIEAEEGTPLPAKEVLSPLLDLNLDLDLALDLAAPIDLAIAANANVAAPIDAAVAANVLSFASSATAVADQDLLIDQHISGEAIAHAPQDATIDQSSDVVDEGSGSAIGGTDGVEPVIGDDLDGPLLNVDVDLAVDADLAAPVAGAVALNANVAAPIDAAVAANIASVDSTATAVADQDAIIIQDLDGVVAEATAEQTTQIEQ